MRYTSDGSEYDRGYHGGHGDSETARRGKADREAEAEVFRRMAAPPSVTPTVTSTVEQRTSTPTAPATFLGSVKAFSILGALLSACYALLILHIGPVGALVFWAAGGLLGGAITGVVVYGVIIIMRSAIVVLTMVVKIAFWAVLALGALYILSP